MESVGRPPTFCCAGRARGLRGRPTSASGGGHRSRLIPTVLRTTKPRAVQSPNAGASSTTWRSSATRCPKRPPAATSARRSGPYAAGWSAGSPPPPRSGSGGTVSSSTTGTTASACGTCASARRENWRRTASLSQARRPPARLPWPADADDARRPVRDEAGAVVEPGPPGSPQLLPGERSSPATSCGGRLRAVVRAARGHRRRRGIRSGRRGTQAGGPGEGLSPGTLSTGLRASRSRVLATIAACRYPVAASFQPGWIRRGPAAAPPATASAAAQRPRVPLRR